MEISIIGSIDPAYDINRELILGILASEQQVLEHGGAFTGRPTTSIYQDSGYVIKLRTGEDQGPEPLIQLGEEKLRLEKELGIYHPAKTWFLLRHHTGEMLGNITPALTPLHTLDKTSDSARMTPALIHSFRQTLTMICQKDLYLDLALSNFALDGDNRLYYLDDDTYPFEEITPLASSIAVLLRHLDGLPLEDIRKLGSSTAMQIEALQCRKISSWKLKLALKQQFMANESQKNNLSAFLTGLENRASETPDVSTTSKSNDELMVLIADIHANLPALEVVEKEIQRINPDRVIVLGDIVGYGPHPRECIDLLREYDWDILKGNHDHAAAQDTAPESGFSTTSGWVIEWTQRQLDVSHKNWLAGLRSRLEESDWIAVHGAPMDSNDFNAYVYHMTFENNLDYLIHHEKRLGFHGHTHLQGIYRRENNKDTHDNRGTVMLNQVDAALICPGSVGQPRGGAKGAELAILSGHQKLEFKQIDYDEKKTQHDMKMLGFPQTLIDRLSLGR